MFFVVDFLGGFVFYSSLAIYYCKSDCKVKLRPIYNKRQWLIWNIRNVGLLPLVSISWAKLMRDQLCQKLKFTNAKIRTRAVSALVLGWTPTRVVERSIITGSAVLTRIRRAIIPVHSYRYNNMQITFLQINRSFTLSESEFFLTLSLLNVNIHPYDKHRLNLPWQFLPPNPVLPHSHW